MKKEDTDRKEFYESKWPCAFFALIGFFFCAVLVEALLNPDTDWYTKLITCWLGCWCLWWLMLDLRMIFAKKEPYIVVDGLRIKYKEKNMLTLRTMNTGKEQSFLWSEIKSLSLCDPYVKLGPIKFRTYTHHMNFHCYPSRKSIVRALKLNLRNGQTKWIFLHTLPRPERRLFFDTIQKYKKVQVEERSCFPISISND